MKIIVRSSWQTQNIGGLAHTPGMLALLEQHAPQAEAPLWPNELSTDMAALLQRRSCLRIAATPSEQERALAQCEFLLHGSRPGLLGGARSRTCTGGRCPLGFGSIMLSDDAIEHDRDILAGARCVLP